MKSISGLRKLLLGIRAKPDGHFRAPCYEKLCGFLRGVEFALDCSAMEGFRERIIAHGGPPNLGWGCGLLFVLFENTDDPGRLVVTDRKADLHACRELLDSLVEHLDGWVASRRRGVGEAGAGAAKTPAQIREVLMALRRRTGMFVMDPYYERVCCLIRGLESVLSFSLTAGLRESVIAAGGPPNLDWDHGFPHTVFPKDPDPLRTVLTDAEADVRATTALLDRIMGRMDAGTDN